VLRRTNFGETDRIVTLYTRERGKLSGIAKGARKPVSRLAGATELLTHGRFQLASGTNLDIITQVDVKDSFPRIRGDLSRIAYATYLLELVDKLVEERDANPEIFDSLLSALYLIERPNDPEKIAHMFELHFMRLLGYEPTLHNNIRCPHEALPDNLYFSPSLGGIVCQECNCVPQDGIPVTGQTMEIMQSLLSAGAHEVEKMEIPKESMDQIAKVMRWYIRYRAERALKSVEFLDTLKAGEA
jgi:DNA repair protein RecO (recombination protein O)